MLDDFKKMLAERRLKDEAIYAQVLNEIENGYRRDGIWAKAIADSKFNEQEAKSLYIRLRVQSIKDELDLARIDAQPSTSMVPLGGGVPQGGRHTPKRYSCNNCEYYGQLLLQKTGFFGLRSKMTCPKCGNTGPLN